MEFIGIWSLLGKSPDEIRGKYVLSSPVLLNFCYLNFSFICYTRETKDTSVTPAFHTEIKD